MHDVSRGGTPYDGAFYDSFEETSLRSAEVVVPMVLGWLRAGSVADAGCGLGIWLSVFRAQGVSDVLGLDGDYVDRKRLRIPQDCFRPTQLAEPPAVGRTFDLAMSLEVAEHLPPASSERFADFLASLAPVLLFSAAIPGQPGTAHINPRWHRYWHEAFARRGFEAFDPLRPLLWHDERVSLHYRQNIFLYARKDWLASHPAASALRAAPPANCLTLIDEGVLEDNLSLGASLRRIPGQLRKRLFG